MKGKLLILGSLTVAVQFANALSYSDGTFADSDWAMVTFPSSPTGQFTEQISAGGNPGAYKRVATINNNFTYNAHLREAFTYDPSSMGAISSIDWSIDYKNFFSFGLGQGYGLVLQQGGTIYRGNFFATGLGGGWQTTSESGLTSLVFGDGISGSSHPNFSSSGSPITFGFMTSNGNAATIDIGYDNYRVTLNSVPEPAVALTLGSIFGGLLLRLRARRQ